MRYYGLKLETCCRRYLRILTKKKEYVKYSLTFCAYPIFCILLRASSLFKFTISINHAQSLLPTRKPEYRLYNILTANLFYCDYQIQQYRQEIFELIQWIKL